MIAPAEEARILALLRGRGRRPEQGMRELHDLTRASIFGLALRMTGRADLADDAVQETYIDVLRGIGGFRGEARLSTWLFRVALRASTRTLSRARSRAGLPTDSLSGSPTESLTDELVDPGHGPAAGASSRDGASRILAAIAALPAPQRAVVALNALEGVPLVEIAEALGVPEGTVHSRLHAARAKLRAALGGEETAG